MSDSFQDLLRAELAEDRAVVVVGAGVSIAATGGDPRASWRGLLCAGVETLRDRGQDKPATAAEASIEAGYLEPAASVLKKGLGPNEFVAWLNETVGRLTAVDPAVLDALAELGAPLLTTNYDHLLEERAHRQALSWNEPTAWSRVLDEPGRWVLHVHGSYAQPASVVFTEGSYASLISEPINQQHLRSLALNRALVFVGVGEGLADDNFGALRDFLARVRGNSGKRHYRLILAGEAEQVRRGDDTVVPVVYGDQHDDLAGFLRGLRPVRGGAAARTSPSLPGHLLRVTVGRSTVSAVSGPRTSPGRTPTAAVAHGLTPSEVESIQLLDAWLREDKAWQVPATNARLRSRSVDAKRVTTHIGRLLFESVFRGDLLTRYRELRDQGALAIELDVQSELVMRPDKKPPPTNLRELPWELLFDPAVGHLAENPRMTLTRVDSESHRPGTLEALTAPRVLVVLAQPHDLVQQVEEEWNPNHEQPYQDVVGGIVGAIEGDAGAPGGLTLVPLDVPTWEDFRQALHGPEGNDIVHIIGHASAPEFNTEGAVAFADPVKREADWHDFSEVVEAFQTIPTRQPVLVFLHLCAGPRRQQPDAPYDLSRASFGQLAYDLLSSGVRVVLAMQYPMRADDGLQFTQDFYENLRHHTVATAVQRARSAVARRGAGRPMLYLQGEDGAIVQLPPSGGSRGQPGQEPRGPSGPGGHRLGRAAGHTGGVESRRHAPAPGGAQPRSAPQGTSTSAGSWTPHESAGGRP
jgi:hypothetical protein